MRKVTVAQHAGFCFGVKRATDRLEEAMQQARENERIFTLGHLIHNETYLASLRRRGVEAIDVDAIEGLAATATPESPVTVLIRAHGCTRETVQLLKRLSEGNPSFRWIDCTCPYVKKIHKIAAECDNEQQIFALLGTANHPEVVGIMSYFDGEKYVFSSAEELSCAFSQEREDKLHKKTPVLVAQTTQNLVNWHQSQKKLKNLCTNAIIFDTICSVTELRQTEARELSGACDAVIVIGGRESSNTAKLYEICRKSCKNTVWIASASELDAGALAGFDHIGIVAGASTPSDEIEEVYKTMSEMNENFEQMLEEQCKTLNTGDVVTGTVTHVSDAELQLDVGVGVTGYIKAEQISDDPAFKLTENFKNGDEVEAFVIRVSDIEGVAELSKKRVDADKNWQTIVAACDEEQVLDGMFAEAV
ncbi:MAG: 4-hydroxy-3-methylbut-2-enyl diphosphate reductase [Clostridia bacterium]|nr:4-hydroxy-3-methylbut-2-enyl diphosphate reductase [Clostridia bacterium]